MIEWLTLIPLSLLDVWMLYNMLHNGFFGSYSTLIYPRLHEGTWMMGRDIRGYSFLGVSLVYAFVLWKLRAKPYVRVWSGILFAYTGLMFFEVFHTLGGIIVFGDWKIALFLKTLFCYAVGLYVTHTYYGILEVNSKRTMLFLTLVVTSLILLNHLINMEFYLSLQDWHSGASSTDPHGWSNLIMKELMLFAPLCFLKVK